MKPIKSKRGQVGAMAPSIIALVLAAFLLIMGLIITQSLRDTDVLKQENSASIINETLTSVDETGDTVSNATVQGFNSFTVTQAVNASNGVVIGSGNYTVNSDTGTVTISSAGASDLYNGTDWKVSYTYLYGGEAFTDANKTLVGLGTFADFWEIMVLAIVITIVITLLLIVFGRNSRR